MMTPRAYRSWPITRVLLATLLLAMLPLLAGQASAPAPAKAKSFLFKATKGDRTIYLLGSIHAGTKDMYPLPKEMEAAFASASALAVEANIAKVDQAKMAALIMKKGMLPADQTLSKTLSKETLAVVQEYCKKSGMPLAALEKFQPWFVGMTLAAAAIADSGLDTELGVDKHFLTAADKGQKPVVELESVEAQIDLLAGLPADLQDKFVLAAVKDAEKFKDEFRKLAAAWKTGDTKTTGELILAATKESPALMAKIIDERNVTMHKGIVAASKEHATLFVVVGAAHIIGDKGIAKLLEKDGFAVEQVVLEPAKN